MRPRKLRHRPSDELIDIRERGLPWLFSVFVVLFLLLTILLFYFIFTTRDVYLSQKQALEEEDIKKKEVAAHTKQESEEDDETWKEHTRRKGKGKSAEEKVHVDPTTIPSTTTSSTTTTTTTTTTEEPTTTTSPIATTTTSTSTTTTETPTTSEATTHEPTASTELPPPDAPNDYIDSEEAQNISASQESGETTDVLLELEDDNIEDVQVEEYEETTKSPTVSTSTSEPMAAAPITDAPKTENVSRNYTRIIWDRRTVRSSSEKFSKFAIISHHEDCSEIGKKIHETGGNAVDAMVATEFCISAVHPHTTGPGFGAVIVLHSKKKNGTFVIDGRERAPKNANKNTFVINPTIAHIGYSSMGVPGWISVLWTAYKQFGSGKIVWKSLIEPTIELLKTNRVRIDRLLGQAFESRRNHILHEKSFDNWLSQATREGAVLRNEQYEDFLKLLKESVHAEHDFYGGQFVKIIVEEMKSRGGLISRQDLESYSCIVTRAETLSIGDHFLVGPHLPYHFPILGKVFQNITESFPSNPEYILEYYVDFVKLLQKANIMKHFVGDDLFEPEVKPKIDEWTTPVQFKAEEQVEQNQSKKKPISFSRVQSSDEEGNSVNFMSTNNVPFPNSLWIILGYTLNQLTKY
ncbi:Gamma-glutamyltransferase [Caenorhabditis elegans]|uniref:Gamma-glutamyltransferase n=1 Tax=Caenorhabditis elegans TaxID=6239 RepID=Q7KX02_CAEEL|nr:Gamma-glutamyltransferase [Caenorhabditis elegans]CCD71179.1 Gamma-glutamyltransferase [Caenorhabditis elegans]|eukprot:NP_001024294.1 Uncharacterized protein CELE_Y97E10AR.2 [Caenorhabditis elegans]